MSTPHDPLQSFASGALGTREADAFREHLGGCAQCQAGLLTVLQLDAAAEASKGAMPAPKPVAPARRGWVLALVGLATAAAAVAFAVTRLLPPTPALGGQRPLEARVSWAPADAHRPYQVLRGAGAAEPLSLEALARLEKQGDLEALASALLWSNDPARARALLERLQPSPDVSADLAAVALAQGRPEDALELAQRALDARPRHARALWNRALAARELGLFAFAARGFGEVAALGEPGWSAEALERQRALDAQWRAAFDRFEQALQAGIGMALEHRPAPEPLVGAAPSVARMYLAYGLRTATSAEEARALLPVARQLDATFGEGSRAVAAVERAAGQGFAARARVTAQLRGMFVDYFRSLAGQGVTLQVAESEAGLPEQGGAELVKAGSADDLLLALPMLGQLPAELARYREAARAVQDPWFLFAARNEQAWQRASTGEAAEAERELREVAAQARTVAPLRAMQANEKLAILLGQEHRAAEQQALVLAGLALTRAQGDVLAEGRLLSLLGDAARFRNLKGLARAALEERALRLPKDCSAQRYLHESLALVHQFTLEPERVRDELTRAAECGEPYSLVGVFALADLQRLAPTPEGLTRFREAVAALRESDSTPAGQAMATHLEGRVELDVDARRGEQLLRDAMARGRALPPSDTTGQKVVAYGFGLLRAAAGERRDFARVLALTSEELGAPLPPCALVIDVEDDRITVAGQGPQGAPQGRFTRIATSRPHPDWVSVEEVQAVAVPVAEPLAQACGERPLAVFAGFPLNGRGGWLPDGIAWSFASALPERARVAGPRLVVSEVEAPPELGLPRLAAYSRAAPAAAEVRLSGREATPERVLAAMREASFIELEAHGLVNPGSEDAALVVLAPGADGFALTASKVAGSQLRGHPVVLLGACRAATVAPALHERWSLPHAFLKAGARAVVAAPVDLPDGEARLLFADLVQRLEQGVEPAVALRDARVTWLAEKKSEWVRSVLIFE
ncbi:MAG: CHAT domain-containing protein [Archangiaceae bacterium]|nr:CHAT domain-containing protein [Archangiaceae bacterium]